MSRFRSATSTPPRSWSGPALPQTSTASVAEPRAEATPRPILASLQPSLSSTQRLGFVLLATYLVANLANDWSQRFLGSRAYLSLITGALLPFACMISGQVFRAFQAAPARWGAAWIVWIAICIPFSLWPGGSTGIFQEFVTKNAAILFYCGALVVTTQQCRSLMNVMAFGSAVVVLSCLFFGDSSSGRLLIPDSIFFENSNDLAIQLLLGAGFLLSAVMNAKGRPARVVAGLFVIGSLVFMLQTSSRANFLSLTVCIMVATFLIKQRGKLIGGVLVIALLGGVTMSADQWRRLVNIVWSPEETISQNTTDGDVLSQMARTEMLKRGIAITLAHPVFGVGPGEYEDALEERQSPDMKRVATQKSHNTYVQVSAELGFPGLILYFGLLISCFRLASSVFREAKRIPGTQEQHNYALCLILILTGYTFSTIFQHVAYGRLLPTLAGICTALWLNWQQIRATAATISPARRTI